MLSANPIVSQVPNERQHVQSNRKPFRERYQRTLPGLTAEQMKQDASGAKRNPPKHDYEEITSVYDQIPFPMPDNIKQGAVL